MRTISLQHGRSQAESLPGPLSLVGALTAFVRKSLERSHQARALADLDDRLLRDVGLSRNAAPPVLPIYLVR